MRDRGAVARDCTLCNPDHMIHAEPSVIGTDAAAERLRVSRSTLTRWVQDGKVAAIGKTSGLRGAYVFAVEEIERKRAERES